MTNIKSKFLLLIPVLLLSLALPARAQFFGGLAKTTSISLTNVNLKGGTAFTWILPPSTNTTTGLVAPAIKLANNRNVSFTMNLGASNATSSATSVLFVTSPDGSHWDTASPYLLTGVPGNAATQFTTNWDFGAMLYVAPLYITNASADSGGAHGYSTNILLEVTLKPGF